MVVIRPEEDIFAEHIHERVHRAVANYCNRHPRTPSFSVGKMKNSCDRNTYYNMLYDFDPDRPEHIQADRAGYARMFTGMVLHDAISILPLQEVNLEFDGIGAHIDDLSLDGQLLLDKKFLSKVENWTDKYLPRTWDVRQTAYYRALAKYGTLLTDVVHDGKVLYHAGEKPEWNVKKVYIVYMPMFDPTDVRVTEPPKEWSNVSAEAVLKGLLRKKDIVESHLIEGTPPDRKVSDFECSYCQWYAKCFNAEDSEAMSEYLQIKLDTAATMGGGD